MNTYKSEYDKLLEENKNNIINWYPFEENATILQLVLDEKIYELKINENTKKIMQIDEITDKENYDYIVIIGDIKNVEGDFSKLVNILKENGKIILITDNKLSIKSMCQQVDTESLYTKKEIENLLRKQGLINQKYYYVFPDYKVTNVIFTDKHLPDIDTISRNITFYPEDTIITMTEQSKMKDILQQDENLFKTFANSYFIECTKNKLEDNEIEFVSYSNIRKEEYKIKTIIKGDKVYKTYANEKAKAHIENIKRNIDILKENGINTLDSYENYTIISDYQKENKTLDYVIIEKLLNNEKQQAIELIQKFYNYLKEKLELTNSDKNVFDKYNIDYKNENTENLNFVKHGLWDLTFQNSFYINNEFFFYDQEWYEENLPIEYIMYRAIIYCTKLQELIKIEEFYNIFEIKEENIKLFEKLDNILQNNTRSDISWKAHSTNTSVENIENKIKQLEEDKEKISEDCFKLLNEKDARIKFLEDNMEKTCELLRQKEGIISGMENSMSWKITKPLRKLKGTKKEENA